MRSRVFSRAGELARPSPSGGATLGEGELQLVRVAPKYLHSNATSHKWPLGAIAELLDNAIDEVANGCERCSSRPRLRCIPASDLLHFPFAPRLSLFVPHTGVWVCSVLGDWLTQPIVVCTRSPSGTFVAVDVEDWWDVSGDPKRMLTFQDNGGGLNPQGLLDMMSLGAHLQLAPRREAHEQRQPQGEFADPYQMDPIQIGARGDSLHPWAFIGEYQRERVWLMMQLREAISRVGERGTIVFIWDLWELESPQGAFELDFDVDQRDIRCRSSWDEPSGRGKKRKQKDVEADDVTEKYYGEPVPQRDLTRHLKHTFVEHYRSGVQRTLPEKQSA
ncbi:MAG: hypothetical protein SGPRY_012749 [Prymnesium sp.]